MHDYRFVGEPIPGPGAALQRWADDRGNLGWALVFPDPWTRHALLVEGIGEVRAFLDAPGDPSILPLAAFESGVVRYTGSGVLVAEILGNTPSLRAGLQLLAAGAEALASALAVADPAGLPSHGALSPWRLLVQPDGSIALLGFGVPPVEALAWLDEEVDTVGADSLRFFPPERLEDRGEDGRSDLFALALIAAELITGAPVLDGGLNAILDAIYDAKVGDRVGAALAGQPEGVIELLCAATEHRITDRPGDLRALATEAAALAAAATGTPLAGLVDGIADADPHPAVAPTQMVDFSARDLVDTIDRPPAQEATEVVDLSSIGGMPDTLIAVRGLVPPPPEPDPYMDEPEITELGPLSTDEAPIPPPIRDLPEGSDLAAVRAHAQSCVTRAELLAALARRGIDAVRGAAGASPADQAAAEADAQKAQKAAATARSSASLLELDDDVGGARITLDLVTRAEQQAETAALRVQAMAGEIMRRGRATRAAEEARERAEGQAEHHSEAASAAAERAHKTAQALDGEREAGTLSDPEALAALSQAWQACDRADEAAGNAESALAGIRGGESHGENLERARAAQLAAEEAARDAQGCVQEARELERKGADRVADETEAEAERAQDGARAARAAAERAKSAAGLVPKNAEAASARTRAEDAAKLAETCAKRALSAAARAKESAQSTKSRAALTEAKTAADEAALAAGAAREAAEEVARHAGAAAEESARLAALRERGSEAIDRLGRALDRHREELDEARAELKAVDARRAHRALEQAQDDFDAVLGEVEALRSKAESLSNEADLETLSAQAEELANRSDPTDDIARARDAARDELAALHAEQQRTRALDSARDAADAHAARCSELVQTASLRLRDRIAALKALDIPSLVEPCARALEILDIASFQAGEAAQSATWAREESDPEEARAHAETGASFASRIELDLPEADALVEQAEDQAREIKDALKAAHVEAERLRDEATRDLDAARTKAKAALDDAKALTGDAVARTRALLTESLDELLQAGQAALEAAATAQAARSRVEAEAAIERAREAATRMAGLEPNVHDRADALTRITSAAREAEESIAASAARAKAWAQKASEAHADIDALATQTAAAVESHRAVGEPVREALVELDRAARDASAASTEALAAAQRAASAQDPDSASHEASLAEEALGRAEAAQGVATEASRTATEAAAEEARARAAARQRRLFAAREQASNHAEHARTIADRVQATHADVLSELDGATAPVALAEAKAASTAVKLCLEAAAEAEEAQGICASTDDEATAEAEARRAQGAALRAQQIAAKADAGLQRARDSARAAAAEADALARVAKEATQSVGRAESAVNRAKEEAREILQLKIALDAKKTLAEQARTEIQGAERALAKVRMTAPMATEAADLGTAQALLETCRATVARAEARADAIQELVAEAAKATAAEAERRAKALAEARQRAKAPAEGAREAAATVEGWVESARRNAGDLHAARASLAALTKAAGELRVIATETTEAGEAIEAADDTAAILRAGAAVAQRASGLDERVESARAHYQAVGAALKAEKERQVAQKSALAAAQQTRTATSEIATQARATVDELEAWLSNHSAPGAMAKEQLERATIAGQAVRDALEAIDQILAEPPASPAAIGGSTAMQLEQAIKGLEAVIAADASCREAAVVYEKERAEAERQAQAAKREAEEAAAQAEKEKALKKSGNREAKRKARLEERKRRFLERRGKSDEEILAELTPSEDEDEASERKVRRWERGKTNATEGGTRPRARPRPTARPVADKAPVKADAADALLQRLRDRQRRED